MFVRVGKGPALVGQVLVLPPQFGVGRTGISGLGLHDRGQGRGGSMPWMPSPVRNGAGLPRCPGRRTRGSVLHGSGGLVGLQREYLQRSRRNVAADPRSGRVDGGPGPRVVR